MLTNDKWLERKKTSKMAVPLLYFPGQRKCKAFPFRSLKKYLVPERGKVRSFLDITGLGIQKPQILWILDWKEGRIKNLRLLEFFSQGKENICLQMAGCKDVKLDRNAQKQTCCCCCFSVEGKIVHRSRRIGRQWGCGRSGYLTGDCCRRQRPSSIAQTPSSNLGAQALLEPYATTTEKSKFCS